MLVLRLGNTAYSLATILAVFMGGLALGSYLGGRLARRVRNPVRVYGLLEIFIGLYCALIPWGIDALQPLLATVYRDYYNSPGLFSLIQFCLCGLVLLFPTILMGVTLPLVAGYAARRNPGVSWTVGLVYGMNTLGAFLGVMVGGFLLIPHIGLSHSNVTGVALSVGVGMVALVASFRMSAISDAIPLPALESQHKCDGDVRERSHSGSAWPLPHWLLLLGFGVSGFAAMSYQVGWTRIVTLSVGSATYAFTLIVGAFILGLALGAPVIGRLGDRRGWSVPLLIGCQLGLSLGGIITMRLLGDLPVRIAVTVSRHGDSFAQLQIAEFTTIFLLILFPTFLMGGMLPLVCRCLAWDGRDGRGVIGAVVGKAYASNTIGAILGACIAGFVMIPVFGMQRTIGAAAVQNALVGGCFLLAWRRPGVGLRIILSATAVLSLSALALESTEWNKRVITSAPYLEAPSITANISEPRRVVRSLIDTRPEPVFYREDIVTTVTVTRYGKRHTLRIAGKPSAGEYDRTQSLLAHLPLLIHRSPRRILILGLGAGGTLHSTLRHESVEQVDCIEISPAVREAADGFFYQNTKPLDDARTYLRIGDGRQHLAMSDWRYDVIVSHPGNPWMAGSSALFTREAFQQMRDRLNHGGVVSVWLQGWMPLDAVRTHIATFHSVFEDMDIWEGQFPSQYILTGYLEPVHFDPLELESRMAAAALSRELGRYAILDAADLLGHRVIDGKDFERLPGPVEISTDDLDLIGTRSARDLRGNHAVEVLRMLSSVRGPITDRLVPVRDPEARDRFLSRSREIAAAKRLILAATIALEESRTLVRAGRNEEAEAFSKKGRDLLRQARAVNARDPALVGSGTERP